MLEGYIKQALARTGIRPSRERGQHFLIDDSVLAAVVNAARLDGSEIVVEIGPGLGTLTQSLARRAFRVHAFELDDQLSRYLQQWVVPEYPNFVLHDVSFNKYMFEPVIEEAKSEGRPLKIVTNLPYQISTQFLQTVAEYADDISLVVVMLQREVAQRVAAKPGMPNFGSFSVYMQTFVDVRWVIDVPPTSFMPPPRVNSAVISLTPLSDAQQPKPANPQRYFKLVRGVFKHRRKTIANALQLTFPHLNAPSAAEVLRLSEINTVLRPQNLSQDDYVRLADAVETLPVADATCMPEGDEEE
ncbi:MAG: 16S rRNA (adenine(1518)-N(6)/adenine(1519)-N(6))-dimethyltransferase RsmA [bacterium]|nr:16S rRNA (adenine(1518)-N(6)/adenine(1519)-N(6))-dimethyltransferase RsmA [bacterium]